MDIMSASKSSLYDEDFLRWTEENAALLRSGNIGAADLGHIAEELEDMGKSQRRELESRVRTVLMHLDNTFQEVRAKLGSNASDAADRVGSPSQG